MLGSDCLTYSNNLEESLRGMIPHTPWESLPPQFEQKLGNLELAEGCNHTTGCRPIMESFAGYCTMANIIRWTGWAIPGSKTCFILIDARWRHRAVLAQTCVEAKWNFSTDTPGCPSSPPTTPHSLGSPINCCTQPAAAPVERRSKLPQLGCRCGAWEKEVRHWLIYSTVVRHSTLLQVNEPFSKATGNKACRLSAG